jgi:hypothetical protein
MFGMVRESVAQEVVTSSAKDRPNWINDPPKGDFYLYMTGIGLATDLRDAQREAIANAMNNRAIEEAVSVQSSTEITTEETDEDYSKRIVDSIVLESETSLLQGFGMEESYWEQEIVNNGVRYRYWVLMRLPRNPNLAPPPPPSYGFTPIYQSAIVPGWGQYTKGKKGKAAVLLTGFAASGAYFLFAQTKFKDWDQQFRDYGATGQIPLRREAEESRDIWNTRRTIGLITFIGIYAFNIADAAASKGEKLYAHNGKPYVQPLLAVNEVGLKISF